MWMRHIQYKPMTSMNPCVEITTIFLLFSVYYMYLIVLKIKVQ